MRVRQLILCALCVLLSGRGLIKAGTIGDAVIPRTYFDGGTGQLFVYGGFFDTPGETVTNWSFYSDRAATNDCSTGHAGYTCSPGTSITPVILKKTSANTFEVTGIGATRTNTLSGIQSNPFDLVAGSDVVGVNFTFGFRSGGPVDAGNYDFGG
jgi:hypothetical protein